MRQFKFEPEDQTLNFSAVTGSPFRQAQIQWMLNKEQFPSYISAWVVKSDWQKYSLISQSHDLDLLPSSCHLVY